MGAWRTGIFDNDTALDWVNDLEHASDTAILSSTLKETLDVGADYLDSDSASAGLAAADVVARLRGNWGVRNEHTRTVDQWVETHPSQPPDELVTQAVSVIDRVLAEESELLELWEGSDEFLEVLADLKQRLSA